MAGADDFLRAALVTPAPYVSRVSETTINPAKWMYERIVKSIISFEEGLDETKEVGARLINFGPREVISIDDVGFWGPDLVTFYGKNSDGNPVELLQHITQVNVLLVAMPVEGEKPNRIGFLLEQRLKGDETSE